jgi:uncharacterized protein YjbJ (UPF0337 family)
LSAAAVQLLNQFNGISFAARRISSPIFLILRCIMNWDQVKGNWKQFTGKVKERWGKLTDDDLTTVEGRRDQLAGRIQERYGIAKEQAEREIDEFATSLKTKL